MQWRDTVEYEACGWFSSARSVHTIVGGDTSSTGGREFLWRGSGALALITCRCRVLAVGPGGGWALVFFGTTPFTAAGVDVYRRTNAEFGPEELEAVLAAARADPEAAPFLPDMVATCKA